MAKSELEALAGLLNKFRGEVDKSFAAQIEAAGWPASREVYSIAKASLDSIDEIINLVRLTKPVNGDHSTDDDPAKAMFNEHQYLKEMHRQIYGGE